MESYKINLNCVFCQSEQFEFDEKNPPSDGDMIKCANCGQLNDVSSIKYLAVENEKEKIAKDLVNDLQKKLNKSFKKFR